MPVALAVFAHPDDIEFRAAGTLILLRERGWDIHYCNLSSGDLGSTRMTARQTALTRAREASAACRLLDFVWHGPIADDLQIFYTDRNIRRVCALVREVRPALLLTHPPQDYMEDHMETCRLAITGAFARGVPNYRSIPPRKPCLDAVTIYHSAPHGLTSPLRQPIRPEAFVNTTSVHDRKRAALACHASQKEWLDASQGMDSYLVSMDDDSAALGKMSRRFRHAEAWTRHQHPGFGGPEDDPLKDALGTLYRRAR
jgi:N-acetylglucosamine malate deacetylase 1